MFYPYYEGHVEDKDITLSKTQLQDIVDARTEGDRWSVGQRGPEKKRKPVGEPATDKISEKMLDTVRRLREARGG